jgi:HPt (histidine-containing phosphotransfer) domain-containing protein
MSLFTTTESEFLVSSLADDPDLGEIVELFVDEMPDRIAHLADSLAAGDWDSLRRNAHQMKGACGSYGFHQVTPLAARVESAARDREDERAIKEAVDELVGLCGKMRARA